MDSPKQKDPCRPSPCGPNSECLSRGGNPSCSCLKDFVGSPPNCRPECVTNSECLSNQACINQHCRDPCPGVCGSNAQCRVVNHTPMCYCDVGYTGDPFSLCTEVRDNPPEIIRPCIPNPCGANAECLERNGVGACQCLDEFFGNPYEGCRPECIINSDCPAHLACVQNKCKDPCPGTCGRNAECYVRNHLPTCTCITGYTGDPYQYCNLQPERKRFFDRECICIGC